MKARLRFLFLSLVKTHADRSAYRSLTQDQPLFFQGWWLDSVAGPDRWSAVIAEEERGKWTAVWPFFKTTYLGQSLLRQAPLTAYLGPRIVKAPETSTLHRQRMRHQSLMKSLLTALPPSRFLSAHLSPENSDLVAHLPSTFRISPLSTFYVDLQGSPEQQWIRLSSGHQKQILRAKEKVQVVESNDIEAFFHLLKNSIQRQGLRLPILFPQLEQLDQQLRKQGHSSLLLALNQEGTAVAGQYWARDHHQAYCLLSGYDASLAIKGANAVLIWKLILDLQGKAKILDLNGSAHPGVYEFLSGFGGRQVWYFTIRKTPFLW